MLWLIGDTAVIDVSILVLLGLGNMQGARKPYKSWGGTMLCSSKGVEWLYH
jgi:hypothetical protein